MSARALTEEVSSFSGIVLPDVFTSEWQDTSSALLEYADRRASLNEIIREMETSPPSWDGSDAVPVSAEASETATRFLESLPNNRELPKVASDGEGNIIFVWEPPHGNCLVTVEPNVLHMVNRPGSIAVEHIDNQPFNGARIPLAILSAVPLK